MSAIQTGTHEVRKVRAHQQLSSAPDAQQRFLILGNTTADAAAKLAAKRLHNQLHADTSDDLDALLWNKTEHWDYLLALKHSRAVEVHIQEREDATGCTQTQTFLQWIKTYAPVGPSWTPGLPDEELAHSCMWGTSFALAFRQWTQTLQWHPNQDSTSKWMRSSQVPIGISWFELAINFILTTQAWFPTPTGVGQHADFRVRTHAFPDKPRGIGLNVMAEALRSINKFWEAVSGETLLPIHWASNVKVLRYFGGMGYVRGFSVRPAMSLQAATMDVVHSYMTAKPNRMSFDDLPTIPVSQPQIHFEIPLDVEDCAMDLQERFNLYRRHTRQVRARMAR